MNPEELALRLNDLGYQPLLDTIKAIDPDLYKVIEALTMVRNNRFGKLEIEIADGKIMMITPSLKIKLR
ncbi:MAG: hypothetical protein ACYDBV_14805 [Nitrospiria bacterium]